MTDTAARTRTGDVTADVNAWLEENWDPELTVGEWWERLGTSGWAAPTWPEEWYGKGLARDDAVRVQFDQVQVGRRVAVEQVGQHLRQREQAGPGVEVERAGARTPLVPAELAADVGAPLVHGDLVPGGREPQCAREAADPGADHHDVTHGLSVLGIRWRQTV